MSKIKTHPKYLNWLVPLLIVGLYFLTHLPKLSFLPVFADESIYIRWTQLIIDDWKQYLFFPMNDGKTPLQMWLMVPLQFMFSDQLYAGRFLSFLIGIPQLFIMAAITRELGGRKIAQWLTMLLTVILPFWFFHFRLALTDPLMVFFLSFTLLYLIKLSKTGKGIYIALSGIGFGLALFSKLPAVLFIPVFFVTPILQKKLTKKTAFTLLSKTSISLFVGLLVFATLKLHPAFGQLFSRGNDFLFSFSDFFAGKTISNSFGNVGRFTVYLATYLSSAVLFLSFAGLFTKNKKPQFFLWLATLSFLVPIILLGKVVYPRYLLPVGIYFTVSAVLALQEMSCWVRSQTNFFKTIFGGLGMMIFVSNIVGTSTVFMYYSHLDTAQLPLPTIDKTQYLHEWSSGHGILESVDFIQKEAQTNKVLVLTEGYFGTLPDAILMYLHRKNVSNLFIEGIGQPVRSIPEKSIKMAEGYDKTFLIVNSHRIDLDIDEKDLVKEFCRPENQEKNSPCLQIWDISNLLSKI